MSQMTITISLHVNYSVLNFFMTRKFTCFIAVIVILIQASKITPSFIFNYDTIQKIHFFFYNRDKDVLLTKPCAVVCCELFSDLNWRNQYGCCLSLSFHRTYYLYYNRGYSENGRDSSNDPPMKEYLFIIIIQKVISNEDE